MRPSKDRYFLSFAETAAKRAACTGRRVGAVLVREEHVVATGYNGTPFGAPNCDEGGCARCADPSQFREGRDYDLCVCVHAEQNALLMAARFGIATRGTILYSTLLPCFGCSKELLQAGVTAIYGLDVWRVFSVEDPLDVKLGEAYVKLLHLFPDGVHVWRDEQFFNVLVGTSESWKKAF